MPRTSETTMNLNQISLKALTAHLKMAPHPEGGFYAETYRAAGIVPASALPPEFGGDRNYSTSILYLLAEGDRSRLHRIRQDEVWHFYLGGPLRLVMISPDGGFNEVIMGQDIYDGQRLQFAVRAGYWFGAAPLSGSGYSLVGCTVAPGFNFADFELADSDELHKMFPNLADLIAEFT